jgi:hypothetical protein
MAGGQTPVVQTEADSVVVTSARGRSPGGAAWRAAVIPGWGQVYNRQYLKLPFLYAGLGFLVYNAVSLHDDYTYFGNAYAYKSYQELVDSGELEENPNEHLKPYYDDLAQSVGEVSSGPIRTERDRLKRNRNLSVLGAVAVYSLSILDAYVHAHLAGFEIGDDVSLRVAPAIVGVSARISYSF